MTKSSSTETIDGIKPAPGLQLEIVVHDEAWPATVTDAAFHATIAAIFDKFIAFDGLEKAAVAFSDDATVRELNRLYRGQDKATNVLSFPAGEGIEALSDPDTAPGRHIGDIIIARETVAREAAAAVNGRTLSLEHHTAHLLVHGILHLFGYDHEDEQEAEEMEALEIDILAELGIANPYGEEQHSVD